MKVVRAWDLDPHKHLLLRHGKPCEIDSVTRQGQSVRVVWSEFEDDTHHGASYHMRDRLMVARRVTDGTGR